MKKQILILMMSLMALVAQAGNEGPQASPVAPSPVVAEISIGSGFGPPSMPRSQMVQVHADGRVVKVVAYYDRTETKEIATLSTTVSETLNQSVRAVKAGEMVDPSPNRPGCMDAPSKVSVAYPTEGQRVVIALWQDCKDYQKSNMSEADELVARALASLWNLGNLN